MIAQRDLPAYLLAMIGFFSITDKRDGCADAALGALAERLEQRGLAVGGAVQVNIPINPNRPCDMNLRILGDTGPTVQISQSLGPGSSGCRLDTGALAIAAARALRRLPQAQIVLINKFGKQEALGGGLRDLFAHAIERGIPVMTSVSPEYLDAFIQFSGDLAVRVDPTSLDTWCRDALS